MRNSSVEVREVVFTEGWPAAFVVVVFGAEVLVLGFAFVIEAVEEVVIVVGWSVGAEPVACCRSFPCSLIRDGPSWESLVRSCGTILLWTRSLTGCLGGSSEYMSMSNF